MKDHATRRRERRESRGRHEVSRTPLRLLRGDGSGPTWITLLGVDAVNLDAGSRVLEVDTVRELAALPADVFARSVAALPRAFGAPAERVVWRAGDDIRTGWRAQVLAVLATSPRASLEADLVPPADGLRAAILEAEGAAA